MGTRLKLLEHRVQSLEGMPPRLQLLENEVHQIKTEIGLARADITSLNERTMTATNKIDGLGGQMSRLFWTGAGVVLTCTFMGSVAALLISAIKAGIFA